MKRKAARVASEDDTPTDLKATALKVHPANRRLVEALTNHVLGLQSTLQKLQPAIRQMWANPDPVEAPEMVRLEQVFRDLATQQLSAAAEIAACRKEQHG